MKNVLLILAGIILSVMPFKEQKQNEIVIPDDSIRLRVISNSNDELDLHKKQELKSFLEDILYNLIKDVKTKDEVNEIIINNLDEINEKIANFLGNNNYKLDYGLNYFPRKVYKGVVYKEGMYDSLVVELGSGKGSNWWCVLFPPLCLLEENTTTTDVEYKLFISRIIQSIK